MSVEQIPRPIEGVDLRSVEVSAQEAFIHSCIDGVLNVEDIADLTVLSTEHVVESIERMISLGVVEWAVPKASSAPPQTELIEDVDLDPKLQERILETYRRSDKLNHYELLGVAVDADRAEIRKAYFALSKVFHPDAYYGKHLGSFQAKMEVIFRKVTDAYEVVGRATKREAYDRYLTRSLAVSAAEHQIGRVEERAQAISKALTKAPSKVAPSIAPGSPEFDRMQRKRELLERKLGRRSQRAPGKSQPIRSMPAPTARVGQKTALRDLTRSLKQTAVLTGGIDRAAHHIDTARSAEAEGDFAAAAAALRMAIALDGSRKDVQEQYKRVNSHLRFQLLDIHREQAKYEEENNLWAAASISWAKVTEAAPDDPIAPRRAAKALMSAGGDLRKARDFALRSLELAPDSLDTRLLLARIYIDAGMDHSAVKELDEAAKLDPGHEMVKNLRKQLGG